jgi:RNA polymerase sigma-70 factor (ECF subfamily)
MNSAPSDSFLPTRQSLLSRLRNLDDQDSWRQFFETYWRLIHDVAVRSGLDESAAQDVVQETVLAAAKQMPEFRYSKDRGSFKGWLLQITRRRVADALRAQYRARGGGRAETAAAADAPAPEAEEKDDAPDSADFEAMWDSEWTAHRTHMALQRLRTKVNPRHFQAFELLTIKEWPPGEVAKALGINLAQIYLVRSRLRRMIREEDRRLDEGLL